MKKIIFNIAVLSLFTIGAGLAQGFKHQAPAGKHENGQKQVTYVASYLKDLNYYDRIVNLTSKQERQINRIEKDYRKMLSNARKPLNSQGINRLEAQKEREILNVLNPVQRQRLVAFESTQYNKKTNNRSSRRG